jgi:hypothetical protein
MLAAVALVVVRWLNWVPSINMETDTYMKSVVPIGALYALTLWLGNSAYLYLSVSFIQMLKVGDTCPVTSPPSARRVPRPQRRATKHTQHSLPLLVEHTVPDAARSLTRMLAGVASHRKCGVRCLTACSCDGHDDRR